MMYKVKIRRGDNWEVKQNAEQIDGNIYNFEEDGILSNEETSIYVGETRMVAFDSNYPKDAPSWIASGDLEEIHR